MLTLALSCTWLPVNMFSAGGRGKRRGATRFFLQLHGSRGMSVKEFWRPAFVNIHTPVQSCAVRDLGFHFGVSETTSIDEPRTRC